MTPGKSSYLKTFSLFLIMIAVPSAFVVLVNHHLPFNETVSSTISFILKVALIVIYLRAWSWLRQKLKAIEGR